MSCLPDTTFALQRGLSEGKCLAYSYLRRKIRAGTGSLYRIRDCRPGVGDMMTKHPIRVLKMPAKRLSSRLTRSILSSERGGKRKVLYIQTLAKE
jgi:hypothetical protein